MKMAARYNKLEKAYREYLSNLSESQIPVDRKRFLELLIKDNEIIKKFGKRLTRPLSLDERLRIAYTNEEERIQTLIFLGTCSMKKHLNKLKIPNRTIKRNSEEISEFIRTKIS
jgi:hypothetical protein